MKILNSQVYVGPNIYALFPGDPADARSRRAGGVADRAGWAPASPTSCWTTLPGLAQHGCSYGEPGGFIRRLHEGEGTWLGHVLEHVAIELQNVAGDAVTFGKTRGTGDARRVYHVVYEYEQARGRHRGRRAGAAAARLAAAAASCAAASDADDFDFDRRARRLHPLRAAARARALAPPRWCAPPRSATSPGCGSTTRALVQLGHGKYQQRIQATVTGRTPHIAVELASDKEETNKLLGDARPAGAASSALVLRCRGRRQCAPRAARLPGRDQAATTATTAAASPSTSTDRRARCAPASRPRASTVALGDRRDLPRGRRPPPAGGQRRADRGDPAHARPRGRRRQVAPWRELVEIVNQDPRRGVGHEKVLTRIELDAQAELHAGTRRLRPPTRCPRPARSCRCAPPPTCRPAAPPPTSPTSSTPTTAQMADTRGRARSASTSAASISSAPTSPRATRSIGGGICEVNAAPGFRMHVAPSEGTPRDAAGPVIDMLFPPGAPGAHPDRRDHRHQRQDHDRAHGRRTSPRWPATASGLTTTDGVYIDGERTVEGDMTGPVAAQMVLRDPHDRRRRAGDRARRPPARRHGRTAPVDVGAVHQRRRRPPGPGRHRHAGAAGRGQADRGRGRDRHARCSTPTTSVPEDGRLHRGQASSAT